MSWISDVKHDLGKLDISIKSLKKFGYTVGLVFVLLSGWFIYRDIYFTARIIFAAAGIMLIAGAVFFPSALKEPYKAWMGLAFVLGWLVSRIILTVLFYFVLFPVGIIAKISGKKFVDSVIVKGSSSYWIKKETGKINYDKMF